jgi:sugar O-acyltransferase (sialic acid O-acetyltransferase NeuD family)
MKCAIAGYGELGRQLHIFIKELYAPAQTIFFDDNCFANGMQDAHPFNNCLLDEYANFSFFIGLGYKQLAAKARLISQLQQAGRQLPSLIHQTAWVSPLVAIGAAVYVYPMCNIDKNVILQDGVLLNNSVTISHDSQAGCCSYLSPGVTLCGFTSIGSSSFIGAGAVVANNISIGNNVVAGIGSVIAQNIADNTHCIGNPLKLLSKPIQLN